LLAWTDFKNSGGRGSAKEKLKHLHVAKEKVSRAVRGRKRVEKGKKPKKFQIFGYITAEKVVK
jgi:hypothetical protein